MRYQRDPPPSSSPWTGPTSPRVQLDRLWTVNGACPRTAACHYAICDDVSPCRGHVTRGVWYPSKNHPPPSPLKETVREEANHTPRRYCQRNGNPLSIMIIRFSPPSINRFYSKDRTNSVRAIIVAALHKTTLQCQGRASLENALRLRAREGEFSGGARIGNN